MRTILAVALCLTFGAAGLGIDTAAAEETDAPNDSAQSPVTSAPLTPVQRIAAGWGDSPDDEKNKLDEIQNRAMQRTGLIPFSLVQPVREQTTRFKNALYEATRIKLGASFHTLFQGATPVLPRAHDFGGTTDFDFVGTWELFNQGQPTQGEVFFGVEGRWKYGPIGPQNIGFASLGSAGGTANSFSEYDPAFILRNLYYKQGGREAGWVFRAGKITSDAMLLTNRNISPNATFLPNAGTGMFVAGYADSGVGAAGNLFLNDNVSIGGLIADANGNRFDFGDPLEGDFYKGAELGLNFAPLEERSTSSKFLLWHTDGTKGGAPINANTGRAGWGFGIVAEQELTKDGRLVVVGRYGKSFNNGSIYDQQAAVHLLLYEPFGWFENDVIAGAVNWIDSSATGSRQEYNFETFYRFPLFPDVDASVSYQGVFKPALTRAIDYSSVFSLRLTTSF